MTQLTEIKLRQQSRVLKISFDDGASFELPCEYLRVFSPSAEVRGHGNSEGTLVTGKRNVNISRIEPVGNYAVRLCIDDAHATGLYSWSYLLELGEQQDFNWQDYLRRLEESGGRRD